MRADGGSIVSVHGDAPIVRSGAEDAELRALLDLPTVRSFRCVSGCALCSLGRA